MKILNFRTLSTIGYVITGSTTSSLKPMAIHITPTEVSSLPMLAG